MLKKIIRFDIIVRSGVRGRRYEVMQYVRRGGHMKGVYMCVPERYDACNFFSKVFRMY